MLEEGQVYSGYDDFFHTDLGCPHLDGPAEALVKLPKTKALKWGDDFCPRCYD